MQFVKDGNVYKAVKITGPSHNLLGLVFYEGENNRKVKLIELPIVSNQEPKIVMEDVEYQVLSGVNEINDELKSNYHVKQIQVVPSDTPDKEVYKLLTKEIIRRIHNGGHFK